MLKLVRRNLLRNKRRTILTAGSVAFALLLLCLLLAVLSAMERAEGSADNRVVVRHAVSLTFQLPESYWKKLDTLDHVRAVTPLSWFGGIYKDERPENFFAQFACDPETLLGVFTELRIPPELVGAWRRERTAFIAGRALAERYGWKPGDRIFLKGVIYPVDLELTLRGIFEDPDAPAGERQIFFHRKLLEEGLGNPGIVGTYFLRLDDPDSVPGVIREAEAMFANSDAQVRAETEKAFQLSFLEMLGNIRLLFGAIGLAVVVSILFITANTMAMAARERTGEVAVLKALGFRARHVAGLLVGESLFVGVLGSVLGVLLAMGVLGAFARATQKVFPIFGTLWITPATVASALAIGAGIGLLSGVVPALGAARLRVAEAIRQVE